MATRKTITLAADPSDDDDNNPSDQLSVVASDDPPEDSADRVSIMMREVSGAVDAKVKVFKQVGGKSQFCKSYSAAEFEDGNLDMLREHFGPGSYKLMLYGTNPQTGNFGLRTRSEVEIAQNLRPVERVVPAENSDALRVLMESQREMLQAIRERPAPPDPMMQMTQMFTMMKLMREAMGGNEQKSSIREMIDGLKELQGASELLNPAKEDDKEPSMMQLGGKLLEIIPSLAKQNPVAAPAPLHQPMPRVTLPASMAEPVASPDAVPEPAAETEDEEMHMLAMLRLQGQMATLTLMAKSNNEVENAAEFVYADLPEELLQELQKDSWFELLTSPMVAPKLVPYREWLTKVRDRVLVMIKEDDEAQAVEDAAEAAKALPKA